MAIRSRNSLECYKQLPSSDCHAHSLAIFHSSWNRDGDFLALHLILLEYSMDYFIVLVVDKFWSFNVICKKENGAYTLTLSLAFQARIFIVLSSSCAIPARWPHDKRSSRYSLHATAVTVLALCWFRAQFTSWSLALRACINNIYNNVFVNSACGLGKCEVHCNLLCSTKSEFRIRKIKIIEIARFEVAIAENFAIIPGKKTFFFLVTKHWKK